MQHNFTSPTNNLAKNAASQFHDLLNSYDLFFHSTPTIHSLDHIMTKSLPIIPPTMQSLFAQFPLVFLKFSCSPCNRSTNSMSYPSFWASILSQYTSFSFFPLADNRSLYSKTHHTNTLSFLIPFYFVYKHHLRHTVVKNRSQEPDGIHLWSMSILNIWHNAYTW